MNCVTLKIKFEVMFYHWVTWVQVQWFDNDKAFKLIKIRSCDVIHALSPVSEKTLENCSQKLPF